MCTKPARKTVHKLYIFFNKLGDESIWNMFLYCQKKYIYIYLLLCISSLTAHALVIRIGYGSYTYFSFESRSGQTKDYTIGICCFSAKYTALMRKSKGWLARNQDDVSEWGEMSIRGPLFQWASAIKIQLSVLI